MCAERWIVRASSRRRAFAGHECREEQCNEHCSDDLKLEHGFLLMPSLYYTNKVGGCQYMRALSLFLCHEIANRCASELASRMSFSYAWMARASPMSRSGLCRSSFTTPTTGTSIPAPFNTACAPRTCPFPPSTTNTRGSGHSE